MSHIRIILGNKLDCVGALFGLEQEAKETKNAAFAADDRYQLSNVDASITNGEEIHEALENAQEWATAVCDGNGDGLSAGDVQTILFDYKTQFEGFVA